MKWNVQRFRGGLVIKAHRLFYHSTLDLRVIMKKKKKKRYEAARRRTVLAAFNTVQGYLPHKKPPPLRTLQ